MNKLMDYRHHADECRNMARRSSRPEVREELLKLAATWDELASQRERRILRSSPERHAFQA